MVEAKIKPILPVLREKKRYLVFEVISEVQFQVNDVSKVVIDALNEYIGTKGASEAGILFLKDKFQSNTGIIRVNNKKLDDLKMALLLIKKVKNQDVIFKTKGVSGILKKAMEKFR